MCSMHFNHVKSSLRSSPGRPPVVIKELVHLRTRQSLGNRPAIIKRPITRCKHGPSELSSLEGILLAQWTHAVPGALARALGTRVRKLYAGGGTLRMQEINDAL